MKRSEHDAWFVREVLPLEAALTRFLARNWRNRSEIEDLRQEVYTRVFEASRDQPVRNAKPFVFFTARNLLIDRARHDQVVSIEQVKDLDQLDIIGEEMTPERHAIALAELRQLQAALDALPPRCREVVFMRRVQGFSQREVAERLGLTQSTVEKHVMNGVRQLAHALFGKDWRGGPKITKTDVSEEEQES